MEFRKDDRSTDPATLPREHLSQHAKEIEGRQIRVKYNVG